MSGSQLTKAGDVEIVDISIFNSKSIAINVINQLISFEIYEDIFDGFISARIALKDNIDLLNIFPLVGGELVSINFTTPGIDKQYQYNKIFCVYRISDKITDNRTSYYNLELTTPEFLNNINHQISRTFKGTGDDIVMKIVESPYGLAHQTLGSVVCEKTSNSFAFTSNWWSPKKCIDYVCAHSLNVNGSPSYTFFQTRTGFQFVSFDTILRNFNRNYPLQTFRLDDIAITANQGSHETVQYDINRQYQQILDIEYHNEINLVERVKNGFYGGTVNSYNGTLQIYNTNEIYSDFDVNSPHLNSCSPVSKIKLFDFNGNIEYIPRATQIHEGFDDSSDYRFRMQRKSYLARLGSSRINIKVHGRTDYTIGNIVKVLIPKSGELNEDTEELYDPILSGNYLVSGVCHIVARGQHICHLELIKDSYVKDVFV